MAANLPVKPKAPAPAASYWVALDHVDCTVKGDRLQTPVSTGVLGAPGTVVLFGMTDVNDRGRARAGGLARVPAKWTPVRRKGHAPFGNLELSPVHPNRG